MKSEINSAILSKLKSRLLYGNNNYNSVLGRGNIGARVEMVNKETDIQRSGIKIGQKLYQPE